MTSNIIIAFLRQNKALKARTIEKELNLPINTLGAAMQANSRGIPAKHIVKITEYLKNYGLETFINSKLKDNDF